MGYVLAILCWLAIVIIIMVNQVLLSQLKIKTVYIC